MTGVTMGDASGVGPEIILLAYNKKEIQAPYIVIGDIEVLNYCNKKLKLSVPIHQISNVSEFKPGRLNVINLDLVKQEDIKPGEISPLAGDAAWKYVERATLMALEEEIASIVTLPMNKESTRLIHDDFSGHTELIAGICGVEKFTMMLASEKLIVTHVSTHVSMLEAISRVKTDKVYDMIKLTWDNVKKLRPQARIAVAGLNPHAGEGGAFGNEDAREIKPAVDKARDEGINVEGPIPGDTVFYTALKGKYDAVVCMYHDQGHIPMKTLDFEGGVNITLGLPVIRTSVDHGTAFDIAWKGIASTRSYILAFEMAALLAD